MARKCIGKRKLITCQKVRTLSDDGARANERGSGSGAPLSMRAYNTDDRCCSTHSGMLKHLGCRSRDRSTLHGRQESWKDQTVYSIRSSMFIAEQETNSLENVASQAWIVATSFPPRHAAPRQSGDKQPRECCAPSMGSLQRACRRAAPPRRASPE